MNKWDKTKLFFYLTVGLGLASWFSLQKYRMQTNEMLACVGQKSVFADSCYNNNTQLWHNLFSWSLWLAVLAGVVTFILFIAWVLTAGENHEQAS